MINGHRSTVYLLSVTLRSRKAERRSNSWAR